MIGDYERVGVVIRTAKTTVWKGFDPALKRDVALKQLSGVGAADAARREAAALAGLQHPNIVSVYDVVDDGDSVWLVEQWITGAPLSAVLVHTGKLRAIDALALIHGALTGLAYTHDRAVIHGDIALSNILIEQSGTPMLVDFGLAVSPAQASMGGTPGYMAPEAASHQAVDKRSDVYSSCVVLAELLKGARLFPGAALAVVQRQADGPSLDGIEAPVADVLAMGLDPRPEVRQADAATLLAQLDAAAEKTHGKGWLALAGLGTIGSTAATISAGVTLTGTAAAGAGATGVGAVGQASSSMLTRRKLVAAGGLVAAVVVAVGAFLLLRPQSSQPTASPVTNTSTTTTPPPAAVAPPPPAAEGPVLSGTYQVVGSFRAARSAQTMSVKSNCPRCDATITVDGATATATWNGTGWERVTGGPCGMRLVVIPTGEVEGIVQSFTIAATWVVPGGCGVTDAPTATGTRIGD